MANTPISGFTSGAPAQSTDELVIARSGANFKLTAGDLKTLSIGAGSVSIASGKTLTGSNTLTLAGTDGTTMTFPATSATLARTDAGNTFTGAQTLGSSDNLNWNSDTILTRRGAANLRLGAADVDGSPVPQFLSAQSTTATTTSNNVAGADFTIDGSQGTGTGVGGSVIFRVAPIGSSGNTRNALTSALTISGGSAFLTTNAFSITNTISTLRAFSSGSGGGIVFSNSGANSEVGIVAGNTMQFTVGGNGVTYVSQLSIGVMTGYRPTADTILARDAANTLALRNGTNAQTARVYGSFTSASVYKRLALSSSTTIATVAAETDTGDMDLALTPAGAGNVRYGTHSAVGAETVTGYITIKDSGGTVRKLAVIS